MARVSAGRLGPSTAVAVLATVVMAGCGGGGSGDAVSSTGGSRATSTPAPPTTTTAPIRGERRGQSAGQPGAGKNAGPPVGATPVDSTKAVLTETELPVTVPCGIVVTREFVRRAYGGSIACVNSQPRGLARSLRVLSVHRVGDEATVKAVPQGGTNDSETLTVQLVHKRSIPSRHWGRIWKVDRLHSNVPVGP